MSATALVPIVGCPDCGGQDLHSFSGIDEPLVRGGGYGEARMTTVKVCPCGWESSPQLDSIRPLRRERASV